MKKTLEKINELVETGILAKYAIGGGMAQFYYIEPSVTYDLDIMIAFAKKENNLIPLNPIYRWAEQYSYKTENEYIIIEGIPVQFLPAYNSLVIEALDKAVQIELFGVQTYILSAEYLMAILLQTNRAKDRERLIKFFDEAQYSLENFENIIRNHNLDERYKDFKNRML